MKIKKNIATSAEGFVFNPSTGDSFSTNPIGTEILSLMKEDKSNDEIIEFIFDKYQVEKHLFEKDFDDFKSQLAAANLIE